MAGYGRKWLASVGMRERDVDRVPGEDLAKDAGSFTVDVLDDERLQVSRPLGSDGARKRVVL
jgi:hypothetical protein